MLFVFVLSISCLFTERGAYFELVFFPAYRCIRILFCMPFFLSIFSSFIQGGFGSFSSESGPHWESRLLILFIIIFEISFLSKPLLIHPHVKI